LIFINDEVVLGSKSYTILSASLSGTNVLVCNTDPADGALVGSASWSVQRRFFEISTPGSSQTLPAGSTVQLALEGADESSPGTGIPGSTLFSNPTAHKFIRYKLTFTIGGTLAPQSLRPQVHFTKFPFDF